MHVFGMQEIHNDDSSLNQWRISDQSLGACVPPDCRVFFHHHTSAMFYNTPDLVAKCFDSSNWCVALESANDAHESKHITCDMETSEWCKSFLSYTIYLWSLFLAPDSLLEFGDEMFKVLSSTQVVRFGHILTRMSGFESFTSLESDPRVRASGYMHTGMRLAPKARMKGVIKPSLGNAKPKDVKELARTPIFKSVIATMGPQNKVCVEERSTNVGVELVGVEIEQDGVPMLSLNERNGMLEFCGKYAAMQEMVNLVMCGLSKLASRFYRTHQLTCSLLNGTFLTEALGGMLYMSLFNLVCLRQVQGGVGWISNQTK